MTILKPEYLFEVSWEVCNKVGGIYAVLSTKAQSMTNYIGDKRVFFIGPDLWKEHESQDFIPTDDYKEFVTYMKNNSKLSVRIGRWNVPGEPIAILVDFLPLYGEKNEIYGRMWNECGVDSLHGYGDYFESSMFGYASGIVMRAFYDCYNLDDCHVVANFNEWMTGFGLFYLKCFEPRIATVFTTHATTVGRSIAGNGKHLYEYMPNYYGDQMAAELNVQSKHSVEKQAAHMADCFTTVSEITNDECAQLLEKRADVVTPNGFELDFVPKGKDLTSVAKKARTKLCAVASQVLGYKISKDVRLCAISGRYEYKNKGIDLYINALNRLNIRKGEEIVAFILVPGWQNGPKDFVNARGDNFTTHNLVEPQNDSVIRTLNFYGCNNSESSRVKVIFVPAYLMGDDGVFNMPYYELLSGFDFTVFPSYYEPWGYTPMESVAFGVPTITTNLSGFGRWVNPKGQDIDKGVSVVIRNDTNFDEVSDKIVRQIEKIIKLFSDPKSKRTVKAAARNYAKNAQWKFFFKNYEAAYDVALRKLEQK